MAVEKLRQRRPIDDIDEEEAEALLSTAEQFHLLSQASQLTEGSQSQAGSPELRKSFYTLVAIQQSSPAPTEIPQFSRTGTDLHSLYEFVTTGVGGTFDLPLIERVQKECVQLLEHLNARHPRLAFRI
jgi:hypothetical protein